MFRLMFRLLKLKLVQQELRDRWDAGDDPPGYAHLQRLQRDIEKATGRRINSGQLVARASCRVAFVITERPVRGSR